MSDRIGNYLQVLMVKVQDQHNTHFFAMLTAEEWNNIPADEHELLGSIMKEVAEEYYPLSYDWKIDGFRTGSLTYLGERLWQVEIKKRMYAPHGIVVESSRTGFMHEIADFFLKREKWRAIFFREWKNK